MAQAVLRPAVLDFIEEATWKGHTDLQMEEQLVGPGSPLDGRTVGTSGLRSRSGLILVAIKRPDGHLAFNPGDDAPVAAGDTLITLGSREQLGRADALAIPDSHLAGAPWARGARRRARARACRASAPPASGRCSADWSAGSWSSGVTLVLKAGMDFVARQDTWFVVVVPLLGLALAVLVLHGFGTSATPPADGPQAHAWRTFHPEAARADISADVVNCAGEEERFPWRLAPIRALAILATVGSGAAMGTEAPAAYLGVAAGDCLGDRGRWWRRFLRPAALAGGAAGVSALMAIPLVGTAFMLELGRRRRAPLSAERVTAALIGGFIGWAINSTFHLNLIRLIVPKEPPVSLVQAVLTALFIGIASGAISSAAGMAVYQAKKWKASPLVRLALGGAATVVTALGARADRGPAGRRRPGRRRHPVGRARQCAPPDLAGGLPLARGGHHRRGRGGWLRRRVRAVPRRR